MYKKLGISVDEQKMMNNSYGYCGWFRFSRTTFKKVGEKGIIFIVEAIKEHPELVRKYLGTVPQKIIFMLHWIQLFSLTVHSVIFKRCSLSNGTFTYFRINQEQDSLREHY
jgi:Fe-S cluster assembly protein SufB